MENLATGIGSFVLILFSMYILIVVGDKVYKEYGGWGALIFFLIWGFIFSPLFELTNNGY